ncbi:unnamed protein product [Paramecium primaurelia]|uniref:Uncharacterized protein n=1 Tax=Paramecium primaurelia TaxID=5886 RepID=A0A8S1MUK3_PARPR|nr:unnamed protein product [Paramecium primaurelia]
MIQLRYFNKLLRNKKKKLRQKLLRSKIQSILKRKNNNLIHQS